MRCLALLLACVMLPAQVVTVTNGGGSDWRGWKRVAVSQAPPHRCGWDRATDVRYVRGDGFVDVQCSVASGQSVSIDLSTIARVVRPVPQLPADPVSHFGGLATNLTVLGFEQSGAGYLLVAAEAVVLWYPSQPGWCAAWQSQPVGTAVPQGEFVPVLGDAVAWPAGDGWTLVWWRHLRDLASALANARVEAREP